MVRDRNGLKLEEGDRVILRAIVREVFHDPGNKGCNVSVEIDCPVDKQGPYLGVRGEALAKVVDEDVST